MNPEITSRGGGASKQVGAAARNFSRNNAGKVGAVLTALLAVILAVSLAVPSAAYAAEDDSSGFDPLGAIANALGLSDDGVETYAVTDTKATAVDPDTTNVWSDIAASSTSTQNIGRIWTDKSVFDHDYKFTGAIDETISKGDSDFLVSLSALSSTSNLKEMVSSSKPLDIVLVLDESTSMGNRIGNYGTQTRLAALKTAVNNFIDATIEENANIDDEASQHRISIVTFEDNARTEIELTPVNSQNKQQFNQVVNGLRADGNTYPNTGFDEAGNVLEQAHSNAQKVVIFFTDGVPAPAGTNDFDEEIATDAINSAHALKQNGSLIYSIGLFNGANPNDTNGDFNQYMNATSSNYPNATASYEEADGWWQDDEYTVTLGQGSNQGYYKTPSTADDLNNVFQEILESALSEVGSGSPIEEVTQGGELNPGTLTFADELGSYMEVSGDTITVVYGDQKFTSTNKTTQDNIDTYHFEGTVSGNAVYKEANLADLTVTVAHGATLADGDVVTVQVPASLLPMRNYDVDTDAKTMSVTAAYPIRLFYGVSVKADAKTAINQGSGDKYDAIVNTNKTDDGKVAFYSNLYNSGSGDTMATFTPSAGNKFYYYTQDTNLYVDQNCTQRATTRNINSYNTLYYSEPYWEITSGNNAQEVTRGIAINRNGQDWDEMTTDRQGNYYIPAGTQRLDRPASLNTNKTKNETGTAATVLTPNWEGAGVAQHLGNNGKITYDLPGELEIKKSVDWGNAADDTKQNQNSFDFTVNFNGNETLEGNFSYDVYESGEEPVSNGTVADGGTITLKNGQRAVVKGLPSDTTFTVTETNANKNGFATTDTVTADPNNVTTDGIANGTIVGGSQQFVSFQNNYKADEPLEYNVSEGLNVEKVLNGRDWRDGDEFTFNVQALDGYAPDVTEVTIDKNTTDHKASFGTITFDKDGEFRYVVREDNDIESPIVGIDYSNATYRLTVKVVDAGNGELKIESTKLEMFQDDTGAEKDPTVAVEGTTATFTNYYLSDQGTINIDGKKAYDDTTGDNLIGPNKFQFQMEALGGYVTDGGFRDNLTVSADDTPKPTENTQGNVTTIGNVGYEFHMPTINFDGNDVGNTYVYKITELQGNEDGMTYDGNSYEVEVTVTEEPDPEAGDGHVHIAATANKTPEQLTFTNKYEPTAAELTGDDAIHGTKTLEGRQMKEGETFYFQLSALNDNAKAVLADPETVTVTDQNSMDFAFSEMKFTKVGTYTFRVNEVADNQGTETTNEDGMTFDTNICTVTVTVTDGNDSDNPDDHGKLLASVSYSNDKHSDVEDHAQFTNVYEANMNYGAEGAGGIAVTKKMVDRTMAAGDFNFTLEGADPDGEIKEEFINTAAAANGTVTMKQLQSLTFDEQDAEKTFTFTVDEADPTDEDRLAGVEYDQSQYRVDITVHDNHDGNMYTETTVTKIKNADGTEVNEVVVDKLNSSTAQGKVPTFGFENVYKPAEASLDGATALQVTKKVTGASSPDGVNYTFTLTAQDTDDGPITNIGGLAEGKLMVSTNGVINRDATDNTDDDTQTVSFGKLTFSKPGTYTFKVQENQPDADDGWTFDDADGDGATDEHTVTVVVSDLNENNEYDGALHIQSVTPQDPTVITNSYKADPVIVGGDGANQQITVQKSVTGADSTADFKFKIEPVIDDTHTQQWWQDRVKATDGFSPELTISNVTQAQAVTNTFAGIQFNAVGEYKFNVTEVGAADFNAGADRKGWTYDEHTAVVTVKVTDEGNDGQLDAEVVYDNSNATTDTDKSAQAAAFTNKYEAGSTTLTGNSTTFNGSKTVAGRSWIDDESFGFTMKPVEQEGVDWGSVTYKANDNSEPVAVGENTATAKKNGDETVSFWFPGSYIFTKAGTYTFNVTETQHNGEALPEDGNGMTYDRHTGVITVTVDDNGEGQLVAKAAAGAITEGDDQNNMVFTNTYEATPVTWGKATGELLGGHKYINDTTGNTYTLVEDQFSFTMRAQAAGNPMPESWDGAEDASDRGMMTVTNGTGDATSIDIYDFGWIEFTHDDMAGATAVDGQPGVYTKNFQYNIFESGDMPAGISKDNTAYTVTFTVTENYNTGEMTATPSAVKIVDGGDGEGTTGESVDVTKLDFTNTYNPTAIDSYMNIFKTLDGRNWQAGDTFTFNVSMTATETDGSEWPQDAPLPSVDAQGSNYTISEAETNEAGNGFDYTVTINPSSATGNTYRFDTGKITYEREGIYTYTVSEADSTVNNVTKDDTEYTVVVTVTDNNGALERKVTSVTPELGNHGTGDQGFAALDFTNKFVPTEYEGVPTGFSLTKVFTGHEWTDNYAFEFELTPDGDAPMPEGTDEGTNTKTITINGPDEGKTDTATFDFGEIKYSKAGTYEYTVTEKEGTTGGVDYNTGNTTANITVNVTEEKADDGSLTGKLVAVATVSNGTFNNEYHASADYNAQGAGGLDITKQLNNRNMTADQFTFTIEATGDNAADAAKKLGITDGTTTTVKNNDGAAGAAVSVVGNPFENMTFDETDDGVTYTYTIKENGTSGEGDYAGYTLDDTTYTVKITATDKGDGTMTVTTDVNGTEYTDKRATVAFENTYKAGDVTVGAQGDAQIVANKTLKNDDIASYDGKFNFQVTSGDVVVAEGTNDANGNITFGNITYTTENLAAAATAEGSDTVGKANLDTAGEADVYTFNYSVSEVTTSLPGGVSYNSGNTNVTVTVTDDRHGKLSVEVGYADGASSVEFVNTYGAGEDGTAELNLKGNKEIVPGEGLTEAPALVDDTYTFEITGNPASDGTPAPIPQTTTAKNKSGAVEFGTITFTMENVFGGTASTTTDESEATQETETVEEATTTKETEVTEGAESEETTTEESADSATAENGEKSVVDESATDESLTDEENGDEATADESSKSVKSEKAATAGVTSSDEDVSTQTAGRTKTFTYTIKETDGSVPGVDNDTTVKTVTVTVTDEGNGKISVSKKEAEGADKGNDFTFTNVYNVDPKESSLTGDGGFTITKTLTGRDMAQGEFSFRLQSVDDDSDFWTAPTNPTAADGEAAEITFGDMTFEKPGTYTYTLEEEQGKLGGVEYDTNKYTVIATVTDKDADGNYTGELEVTWQINGAADNTVAFKNTYTAQPATVSLGAGKLMKGRDLSAGEYTFKLSDTNGNEVSTATNEENGAVTFDTITYDQAGEYTYTIIEVTPEDTDPNTEGIQNNGVTYDQTVYNATVKVTDNAKGQLVPTISYGTEDGGAPVFTNTYTAPAEPEQGGEGDGDGGLFGMAKTGDFTGGIMAVLAAAVAAAAAGATYAIRKMRRPRGRHAR